MSRFSGIDRDEKPLAEEYADVRQGRSKEDIEVQREKMARLEAEYSDNPAYLAWMEQKFAAKELEVTSQ